MKHGAWTPCPKCGHTPEEPEDKAKHVMTSDHYFSQADLEGMSARIQSGQPLQFDQEQVGEFVSTLNSTQLSNKGFGAVLFGIIVVAIIVIVGAIYLSTRFLGR